MIRGADYPVQIKDDSLIFHPLFLLHLMVYTHGFNSSDFCLFLVIILSQKRRKVKTISDILPRETEERRLPAE